MSSKPYSEACERNREPIATALDPWMGDRHRLLEIGSGTGQHAAFFAERWPWLRWQPSDHPDHLPGIEAWRAEAALLNLLPPLALQVELPPAPGLSLPQGSTFDAAFSANTLHIMGWEHVQALFAALPPHPLTVWLKLDSGMHRLGLDVDSFRAAHARLSALPQVERIVLMTHLARADELDSERTHEQAATFARAIDGLSGETSVCNSPALLGWPDVRSDWVRPGLMLYGANPLPEASEITARLRPVMTMQSKVIAERWIEAGEPVGYGARFVAKSRTRVGVVALGYADGYPQFAPNGTPVLIDGQPGGLIGRVSMDMLTVDLTAHPQAGIGSVVELWGTAPTLSELAPRCGVSAYQLPCAVKRVARVYQD